jgi:hypothetical protein
MKKYLLSENGNFYKANLHCHTNISDGALTPAEIKKIYSEQGYSIVAFTDHNILIPHKDLNDEGFLALHGFETDFAQKGEPGQFCRSCHICFISPDPDYTTQPLDCEYTLEKAQKYLDPVVYDKTEPPFQRIYSSENINFAIKYYRDKGFFATYNHPTWSGESYPEYSTYKGMNAFEIYNNISFVKGHMDYNPRVYDDILRLGSRIFAIAADDNHNRGTPGTKSWDSFGGFTMIKADKLDYDSIIDALFKGNFYASTGPLIHSLWIEDGIAHITCSKAKSIFYGSGSRLQRVRHAEDGEYLTEVSFAINEFDNYMRFTVIDENGKCANTNAYFLDEILD